LGINQPIGKPISSQLFNAHYATTSAPGQKPAIIGISTWPGAGYWNDLDNSIYASSLLAL
jgi:hypothetical protein